MILQKMFVNLLNYFFRLKKEEDDWNKLFTDLEEKAVQAERYQKYLFSSPEPKAHR